MKQKRKDPMEKEVLYLSTFSNARIAFDGIAKESKNGILPFRAEKFEHGQLFINPIKDYGDRRGLGKDIMARLDDHPANRANGGTLFYKVDSNARDIMEFQQGMMIVAREPSGGITKEIATQLGELYKAMTDGYDKDAHDILVDEIGLVFDTFSVLGILKPEKEHNELRVRARLTEFFSVLEERDIWAPPAEKAKK